MSDDTAPADAQPAVPESGDEELPAFLADEGEDDDLAEAEDDEPAAIIAAE